MGCDEDPNTGRVILRRAWALRGERKAIKRAAQEKRRE